MEAARRAHYPVPWERGKTHLFPPLSAVVCVLFCLLALLVPSTCADQTANTTDTEVRACKELVLPGKLVGILLLVNQSLNVADKCQEFACLQNPDTAALEVVARNCSTFLAPSSLPERCKPNFDLPFPDCCLRPRCQRHRPTKKPATTPAPLPPTAAPPTTTVRPAPAVGAPPTPAPPSLQPPPVLPPRQPGRDMPPGRQPGPPGSNTAEGAPAAASPGGETGVRTSYHHSAPRVCQTYLFVGCPESTNDGTPKSPPPAPTLTPPPLKQIFDIIQPADSDDMDFATRRRAPGVREFQIQGQFRPVAPPAPPAAPPATTPSNSVHRVRTFHVNLGRRARLEDEENGKHVKGNRASWESLFNNRRR